MNVKIEELLKNYFDEIDSINKDISNIQDKNLEYKSILDEKKSRKTGLLNLVQLSKKNRGIKEVEAFIRKHNAQIEHHKHSIYRLKEELYKNCLTQIMFLPENKEHYEKLSRSLIESNGHSLIESHIKNFESYIVKDTKLFLKSKGIIIDFWF